MAIDGKAADILSRGFYKEGFGPEECQYLLTFTDRSPEANLTVSLADRLTRSECDSVGRICAEIAVSTGPCPHNCAFCRYAEGTTDSEFWDIEDSDLERYVDELCSFSDVAWISLMSVGGADPDLLAHYVGVAHDRARPGTRIYVDAGETDASACRALRKAGAYGAFHSLRVGEGRDTEISAERRKETISDLVSAGLSVITGTGPIGPDTDPREAVDAFFATRGMRCSGAAVYARDPVPGTRLGKFGKLQAARLNQFRAAFTLATSRYDFPINEPNRGTYVLGNNVSFARYNGTRRKDQLHAARRRLFNRGYDRILKTDGSAKDLTLAYLRQTGSV